MHPGLSGLGWLSGAANPLAVNQGLGNEFARPIRDKLKDPSLVPVCLGEVD